MKKYVLIIAIALVGITSAMAQQKMIVTDVEEGITYLTPVFDVPNGGAMIKVTPADIVNKNTVVPQSAGRIKVLTGPSEKAVLFDDNDRAVGVVKICYDENNWPCLLIRTPREG